MKQGRGPQAVTQKARLSGSASSIVVVVFNCAKDTFSWSPRAATMHADVQWRCKYGHDQPKEKGLGGHRAEERNGVENPKPERREARDAAYRSPYPTCMLELANQRSSRGAHCDRRARESFKLVTRKGKSRLSTQETGGTLTDVQGGGLCCNIRCG